MGAEPPRPATATGPIQHSVLPLAFSVLPCYAENHFPECPFCEVKMHK
jgi:hypothetical protein